MSDEPRVLADGRLPFAIERLDGSKTEHAVDVLLLRLTCEECEQAHNLPTNEQGCYKPTAAFLADLAGRIAGLGIAGLGIAGCTPSVAYQLWNSSSIEITALKKNTSETPSSPTGSESTPAE